MSVPDCAFFYCLIFVISLILSYYLSIIYFFSTIYTLLPDEYELISFSITASASVTLDRPDSSICTDFSLNGRLFTVTTEKEIQVFPLPPFFSSFSSAFRNQENQGLPPLGEGDEELGTKVEVCRLQSTRLCTRTHTDGTDIDDIFSKNFFSSATVISTIVTPIITEIGNFLPTDLNPDPSLAASSSSKKNSLKTKKPVSAAIPSLNSIICMENLTMKIQIAIFNKIYSFWMIVEGNILCERRKGEKNDNDQFLEFCDVKKNLEISVFKSWKLSGNVSTFCFNGNRNVVALGLQNGKTYFN